jgi:hypothetical protein
MLLVYFADKLHMIKNTEVKLVGQPILSQVLQLVDKVTFQNFIFCDHDVWDAKPF